MNVRGAIARADIVRRHATPKMAAASYLWVILCSSFCFFPFVSFNVTLDKFTPTCFLLQTKVARTTQIAKRGTIAMGV